jgi:hypothetical protein
MRCALVHLSKLTQTSGLERAYDDVRKETPPGAAHGGADWRPVRLNDVAKHRTFSLDRAGVLLGATPNRGAGCNPRSSQSCNSFY